MQYMAQNIYKLSNEEYAWWESSNLNNKIKPTKNSNSCHVKATLNRAKCQC